MNAIVTSIRIEQDTDVAYIRRAARVISESAGTKPRDQARFATAVSEIARNALQYAVNGVAEFSFAGGNGAIELVAKVSDDGPGITAPDSLGASRGHVGLGIAGSRKLVDEFELQTGQGGTVAVLKVHINGAEPRPLEEFARGAQAALGLSARFNPIEELTEQNRALRAAFAQQEFLMRELHHRTKNNLALIGSLATLQARRAETEEARRELNSLARRISAFAAAHTYLHRAEDVTRIDLKPHLDQLVGMLSEAFAKDDVQILTDIESVTIDAETALDIGLIVNELVTNSAKHASLGRNGPCISRIEARRQGDRLRVCVSDNGPGLANAAETLRNGRSLGWRVIEASARKLKADLTIDGSDGLSVALELDLREQLAATEKTVQL